jgi:hypothetical protein
MNASSNIHLQKLKATSREKRLSLVQCRKTLLEEAKELTDEEVIEIRDFLYQLASIAIEHYQNQETNETPVNNVKKMEVTHEKENHYLRAS